MPSNVGSVEAVSPPPSRRTKGAVLAALSLATPLALVLGTAPARAAPPTVTITVDAAHPGRVIPRDFVGLSFEADQLHRTWTDPDRGNVAALLGNLAKRIETGVEEHHEVLQQAGLPDGVFDVLHIDNDQAAEVLRDARVKAVTLTGSERAGRSIASNAGSQLKKSVMELGGSDAFVVLDDADLDKTVAAAVKSRFDNSGQTCIAAKRFIVVESMADAFLEKFQAALENFKPGDPMDKQTTLAPLSSSEALKNLLGQVDEAVAGGARVLMGGKRIEGQEGAFMQPTVLADIDKSNPAYMQEFFGPVALFFRVADENAAVALANDSPFGLGGSVFTQDIERGKRVARRIDTGMVFINSGASSSPELPFGGVKNSGYGRELSGAGIQEFVNKKLIRIG